MNKFYSNFLLILSALSFTTAQDVILSITDYVDNSVSISVINTTEIGGFQLNLTDNPDYFSVTGAGGGLADEAGFMMSTNESGMVLGFSLTGNTIPVGEGVLTIVNTAESGENPFSILSLEEAIFSDSEGGALTVEISNTYGIGEMVPLLTINSPQDGDEIFGNTIDISVSSEFTVDGDHYHAYLDSAMTGMYFTDEFSFEDVAFGTHILTVSIADESHGEYENSEASVTIVFTNTEQPPLPGVTIVSPSDGDVIFSHTIDVVVEGVNLGDGDHYHGFLDGNSTGMYYSNEFSISDVSYGSHTFQVVVADGGHNEYDNPEASDIVNFSNEEEPVIESTIVTLGSGTVNAGESITIGIDLENPEVLVSGFQFQIVDWPNYLDATDIQPTERTEGWSMFFNEQDNGSIILVGFDMSGVGVGFGTGSIADLTYQSTGIYSTNIQLSIVAENSVLSDRQTVQKKAFQSFFERYQQ